MWAILATNFGSPASACSLKKTSADRPASACGPIRMNRKVGAGLAGQAQQDHDRQRLGQATDVGRAS